MIGNALADGAAEVGGEYFQPPFGQVRSAKWAEAIRYLVAMRIALIHTDIWDKQAGARIYDRPDALEFEPVNQRVANSSLMMQLCRNGHRLHRVTGGLHCEGCKRTRPHKKQQY